MRYLKIITAMYLLAFNLSYGVSSLFYEHNKFLLSSAGTLGTGFYGYANPALLTYQHQLDLAFIWSDLRKEPRGINDWMFLTGMPHFSCAIGNERFSDGSIQKYYLALSLGDKRQSIGIGYQWTGGDKRIQNTSALWKIGYLLRPRRHLSLGFVGLIGDQETQQEIYFDLGIRPLGNEKVTFFVDCAVPRGVVLKDSPWSTGIVLEPLPGIRFTTRYFNDRSLQGGINISLGRVGLSTQTHYDDRHSHQGNTYGIRMGAYDRNIFRYLTRKNKNYLELELFGPLHYQRYLLFDKSNTLLSLLQTLEMAKQDETIKGIALNLSGIQTSLEMAWELREKLRDFKVKNKKIIVYIDEAGFLEYYLASVADFIVIDPQGGINLQGLLMGRMFFKNALDKIGIGVDEWRYFKYKSAAEVLSRDKMSEADREQRQAIIDDYYYTIKTDICSARGFSPERFDQLVNEECIFLPTEAVENNLADTVGRWDEMKEIVKNCEGANKRLVPKSALSLPELPPDNYWGERPKIAIIYGLGECAMDTGIKARKLVKDFEWVTGRRDIKAVVFRVDSPGGSPLASDIIAEAIKKCQKKKPVVVSQGSVAGSGGYWLSMYGDKIIAAPFTMTGSIGVIGLWLYNKELKERLGFSTDFVRVGEHADLGFGFQYPFLGQLPDRNLTVAEKQRIEYHIKSLYKDFVTRVAQGRNKSYEEIETIAQGRVWSGLRGKEIGLVDTLGGLETAIKIAKNLAGIEKEEITIVELPRPELFPPNLFTPRIIQTKEENSAFIRQLNFLMKNNGRALLIMPVEYLFSIPGDYLK
ncbi:MAG: signal peptide peptidase SppA [candidate division WOR-3 bacterium]